MVQNLCSYGLIQHTLMIIKMVQNLHFYGRIQLTQMIIIMIQWYCLSVLYCPVWQQFVFRLPKWQFASVMNQKHGLYLHVLICRNKLAFCHLNAEINLLFIILNTSWMPLVSTNAVSKYMYTGKLVNIPSK